MSDGMVLLHITTVLRVGHAVGNSAKRLIKKPLTVIWAVFGSVANYTVVFGPRWQT